MKSGLLPGEIAFCKAVVVSRWDELMLISDEKIGWYIRSFPPLEIIMGYEYK